MPLVRKNYHVLGPAVGPYVHAVKSDGLLFLSGLTAFGTPQQKGGLAQEARAIFEQIKAVCEAEGTDLSALIKVTLYVTDLTQIAQLREVLFEVYGDHLPASSLLQVAALFSPEISIEIEAIVQVPSDA